METKGFRTNKLEERQIDTILYIQPTNKEKIMKKETFDAMEEAIGSLQTSTKIMHNDIRSLIALYDENRKQIIISTFAIMKDKIDFLSNEVGLISEKDHFVKA